MSGCPHAKDRNRFFLEFLLKYVIEGCLSFVNIAGDHNTPGERNERGEVRNVSERDHRHEYSQNEYGSERGIGQHKEPFRPPHHRQVIFSQRVEEREEIPETQHVARKDRKIKSIGCVGRGPREAPTFGKPCVDKELTTEVLINNEHGNNKK